MPQNRSMKKRLRQLRKRTARNRAYRSRMRNAMRAAREAGKAQADDLQARAVAAQRAIDKAAKVGAIHRRNAARKKSRLMKAISTS
jgi:small subunit ribosomal protein S20